MSTKHSPKERMRQADVQDALQEIDDSGIDLNKLTEETHEQIINTTK